MSSSVSSCWGYGESGKTIRKTDMLIRSGDIVLARTQAGMAVYLLPKTGQKDTKSQGSEWWSVSNDHKKETLDESHSRKGEKPPDFRS